MKRIAKFHKVSLEQFMEGWKDTFGEQYTEDQIKALYEEIKLPKRATAGSAGYDFYAPDDFYSDNEGHIFAKLTNDTNENKTVELGKGTGFMQGIFVEYGITVDDDATAVRNGGFGSTTK